MNEDITKTGNQTHEEITNQINNMFADEELFKRNRDAISAMELTSSYMSEIYKPENRDLRLELDNLNGYSNFKLYEEEARAAGFGKSRYDENLKDWSELDNLEDLRARHQSTFNKWMSALGKMGVITLTTLADNTLGTVVGLVNLAAGGSFVENPFSVGINEINKKIEEAMPNYRTAEEQNNEWYENLGTANFWADSFLKNTGYFLGSYLSGAGTAKMLSNVAKVDKFKKVFEGLTTVGGKSLGTADDILKAYKTGDGVIDGTKLTNNMIKAAKTVKNQELGIKILSGIAGAVGESRMTILSSGLDNYDRQYQLLTEEKDKRLSDEEVLNYLQQREVEEGVTPGTYVGLTMNNETGSTTRIPTEKGATLAEQYKQQVENKYNESVNLIADEKKKFLNRGFALNMLITSFDNIWQFGDALTGGLSKERNIRFVKKLIDGKYGVSKKELNEGLTDIFGGMLFEGFQEMSQDVIDKSSVAWSANKLNEFYGSALDPKGVETAESFIGSFLGQLGETLTNPDEWESFVLGAITSLAGGVMPGSSVREGISKIKGYKERSQATADAMNKFLEDPNKVEHLVHLTRMMSSKQIQGEAIENNDAYTYKNEESKQLISTAVTFAQAGKFQDLLDLVERANTISIEDVETIKSMVVDKKSGESLYQNLSDEEIVETFNNQKEDRINAIKKIYKLYNSVSTLYNNSNPSFINSMVYLLASQEDRENRINSISSNIIDVFNGYVEQHPDNPKVESIKEILNLLKDGKLLNVTSEIYDSYNESVDRFKKHINTAEENIKNLDERESSELKRISDKKNQPITDDMIHEELIKLETVLLNSISTKEEIEDKLTHELHNPENLSDKIREERNKKIDEKLERTKKFFKGEVLKEVFDKDEYEKMLESLPVPKKLEIFNELQDVHKLLSERELLIDAINKLQENPSSLEESFAEDLSNSWDIYRKSINDKAYVDTFGENGDKITKDELINKLKTGEIDLESLKVFKNIAKDKKHEDVNKELERFVELYDFLDELRECFNSFIESDVRSEQHVESLLVLYNQLYDKVLTADSVKDAWNKIDDHIKTMVKLTSDDLKDLINKLYVSIKAMKSVQEALNPKKNKKTDKKSKDKVNIFDDDSNEDDEENTDDEEEVLTDEDGDEITVKKSKNSSGRGSLFKRLFDESNSSEDDSDDFDDEDFENIINIKNEIKDDKNISEKLKEISLNSKDGEELHEQIKYLKGILEKKLSEEDHKDELSKYIGTVYDSVPSKFDELLKLLAEDIIDELSGNTKNDVTSEDDDSETYNGDAEDVENPIYQDDDSDKDDEEESNNKSKNIISLSNEEQEEINEVTQLVNFRNPDKINSKTSTYRKIEDTWSGNRTSSGFKILPLQKDGKLEKNDFLFKYLEFYKHQQFIDDGHLQRYFDWCKQKGIEPTVRFVSSKKMLKNGKILIVVEKPEDYKDNGYFKGQIKPFGSIHNIQIQPIGMLDIPKKDFENSVYESLIKSAEEQSKDKETGLVLLKETSNLEWVFSGRIATSDENHDKEYRDLKSLIPLNDKGGIDDKRFDLAIIGNNGTEEIFGNGESKIKNHDTVSLNTHWGPTDSEKFKFNENDVRRGSVWIRTLESDGRVYYKSVKVKKFDDSYTETDNKYTKGIKHALGLIKSKDMASVRKGLVELNKYLYLPRQEKDKTKLSVYVNTNPDNHKLVFKNKYSYDLDKSVDELFEDLKQANLRFNVHHKSGLTLNNILNANILTTDLVTLFNKNASFSISRLEKDSNGDLKPVKSETLVEHLILNRHLGDVKRLNDKNYYKFCTVNGWNLYVSEGGKDFKTNDKGKLLDIKIKDYDNREIQEILEFVYHKIETLEYSKYYAHYDKDGNLITDADKKFKKNKYSLYVGQLSNDKYVSFGVNHDIYGNTKLIFLTEEDIVDYKQMVKDLSFKRNTGENQNSSNSDNNKQKQQREKLVKSVSNDAQQSNTNNNNQTNQTNTNVDYVYNVLNSLHGSRNHTIEDVKELILKEQPFENNRDKELIEYFKSKGKEKFRRREYLQMYEEFKQNNSNLQTTQTNQQINNTQQTQQSTPTQQAQQPNSVQQSDNTNNVSGVNSKKRTIVKNGGKKINSIKKGNSKPIFTNSNDGKLQDDKDIKNYIINQVKEFLKNKPDEDKALLIETQVINNELGTWVNFYKASTEIFDDTLQSQLNSLYNCK